MSRRASCKRSDLAREPALIIGATIQKATTATTNTAQSLQSSANSHPMAASSQRRQNDDEPRDGPSQAGASTATPAPAPAPAPAPSASGRAATARRGCSKLVRQGRRTLRAANNIAAHLGCFALAVLVATVLLVACGKHSLPALADETSPSASGASISNRQQAGSKAALEAELNAILQQQELGQETNSALLSEAIISRLMLGNLTDIGPHEEAGSEVFDGPEASAVSAAENAEAASYLSGPDARLRKMLGFLQNYELSQAGLNGGQAFSQYPILPSGQAATIKRASAKMTNYLRGNGQHPHSNQRQLTGYGRVNSFDFGLGKRPDSSVSGNILRFGDSASAGGHMAAVSGSGLGKRPSAHRYDFGLGKRVANPAYPRYDFGLGKRAPSRVRYDFGLGK